MAGLATVRSLGSGPRLRTTQEFEDFEQELVDQYLLAMVGAGSVDSTVAAERATIFDFLRFLGAPVWTTQPADADRYLSWLRRERQLRGSTVHTKAAGLAQFFGFLLARYQGDIHALTGFVLVQPVDEFNLPTMCDTGAGRVPPSTPEVEVLFSGWRESLPEARKFLPAARDYLAASLWRRAGLRISESAGLDVRDWRPDLGEFGKLHVRLGKGSRGRGPKTRLVPCIDGVEPLLRWWFTDVRHQFGEDYADPDAPLLPSERRDPMTGQCLRAGSDALRTGLAAQSGSGCPPGTAGSPRTGFGITAPPRCMSAALTSKRSRNCSATRGCRPRRATSTFRPNTSSTPGCLRTPGSRPDSRPRGEPMRWNLRMTAAEHGIWKSIEMRRRLADAGLDISGRQDVSAVDHDADLDPPRRPRCHLRRARMRTHRPADLRTRRHRRPPSLHGRGSERDRALGRSNPQAGSQPFETACVTQKRPGARPLRRAKCITCATAPAAMAQVDYCFACWPGGPVTPPPCLRCGSRTNYYTSGICRRCHRDGNPAVESCQDCHAWGTTRWGKWLCHGCRSWRREHSSIAACRICTNVITLGENGVCRLCRKQGTLMREGKELLDIRAANTHG